MIKNDLSDLISQGKFLEGKQLLKEHTLTSEELEGVLLEIAYDQKSIAVYSFVYYLISQNESVELHNVAALLMTNPLCFVEGAYHAGLHHVRRAIEMAPLDVSIKELILFLNLVPDQVVSKKEAVECAKQILSIEPHNKAAQDFLSSMQTI